MSTRVLVALAIGGAVALLVVGTPAFAVPAGLLLLFAGSLLYGRAFARGGELAVRVALALGAIASLLVLSLWLSFLAPPLALGGLALGWRVRHEGRRGQCAIGVNLLALALLAALAVWIMTSG